MRMLAEFFPEFADMLDEMYRQKRMIDEKTYQFICFAVSIKTRSKPCVLKHFKGALEAGATVKELAYILALVMREAAGAVDCWTHDFWTTGRRSSPVMSTVAARNNSKVDLARNKLVPLRKGRTSIPIALTQGEYIVAP